MIESVRLDANALETVNLRIQASVAKSRAREVRYECAAPDDAELLVVAFGSAARIAKTAVERSRAEGIRAGLFRPITASPFPYDAVRRAALGARQILVFELNAGQMLEDVRLAVEGADHVLRPDGRDCAAAGRGAGPNSPGLPRRCGPEELR